MRRHTLQSELQQVMASTKGDGFFFCGGKYNGMTGWIDASNHPSSKRAYVIVDLGDGVEKATC
eukprot:7682433-Ditylum_brightwellii.AAC.1